MEAQVIEIVGKLPIAMLAGSLMWMFRNIKADIRELRASNGLTNCYPDEPPPRCRRPGQVRHAWC